MAQGDPRQVLVLYAVRRDSQFAIIGETELPRILDTGLARNLDYYPEYIDLSRFPDPAYTDAFRDFLRLKYQGVEFDLVIAMQDAALAFVTEHRDVLFPASPVVFLSNTPVGKRLSNATGLIQARDYTSTLTFLQRLQPDVTQIFIVTGAVPIDQEYERAVRTQFEAYNSGLTFTFLSGLTTTDLTDRLSRLPEHSAVYYVLVSEDGAGNRLHPLEYAERVSATASAPVYSWVDSTMGRGILGGSLYSQRAVIDEIGQLALRVLRGERADEIPVSDLHINTDQVDWRQLRRWSIDEARVPEGTLVQFRDPSVWYEYRTYILGAGGIFLVQTLLIGGLIIQRSRRRRAEEQLRERQSELRKSYERNRDLGARLLRAQETEHSRIAAELHDDICQRMALLTIELDSLRRAGDSHGPPSEALTLAQDIAKSLTDLSHRLHPTRLRLLGLVAALEQLCSELSRGGLAITFTHENVPTSVPAEVMLCLFRIVQEGLRNAIKHSSASMISVELRGGAGGLTLMVSDNGAGFDVEATWGTGLGLVSMTERMEAIGGTLTIRSDRGSGTQICAQVPPHVVAVANASRKESEDSLLAGAA